MHRIKSWRVPTIFWDITPCSPLSVNRRFGGTYPLHFRAICSSDTSVDTQRTSRRYVPEHGTLHNHRCENLISYKIHTFLPNQETSFTSSTFLRHIPVSNPPTNSIELTVSWEANHCSHIQEIPSAETQRFVTVFTKACRWSLSWARWIQHTISLRYFLTLSSHILLGFRSGSSVQVSFIKILSAPLLPHACYMPCSFLPPWCSHCNIYRCVQVTNFLTM
jgi:hypothetical protein